jgi:hypothetical protein
MKKPTWMQCFLARDWLVKIWLVSIPLAVAFIAIRATDCTFASLTDWQSALGIVGILVLSLLLGFFLAVLLAWPVLGVIYYMIEDRNGGPFKVGDTVQILTGPYKGRVSQVYSTWQGSSVRVELGEKEKEEFKDIFSPIALLREEPSELACADAVVDHDAPKQ